MKKFLLIALVSLFAFGYGANAQYVKSYSKTITAADTTTFTSVPGKIKAFAYTLTKTTGTVAGKVYLEGSVIDGAWVNIDSTFTLADVSTIQSKVYPITATTYLNYRFRCSNTSAATAKIKATYLRRTDE